MADVGRRGREPRGGAGQLHVAAQVRHQDRRPVPAPTRARRRTPATSRAWAKRRSSWAIRTSTSSAFLANADLHVTDNVDLYATVIGSNRDITSFAFYRSKNHSGQGALLAQVYPNGYVPEINQDSRDRSVVLGARGTSEGGWKWDVSYNFGENDLDFYTQNTINYSLGANSPHRFFDGTLRYRQDVINADFSKAINIGLAYPATLSLGAESRQEEWEQAAGEPSSYTGSGAQGFAGFTPRNAGNYDRDSFAVYAGLEADLTDRFSAGIAGRYEDYSDFGNQTSASWGHIFLTDAVALRRRHHQ